MVVHLCIFASTLARSLSIFMKQFNNSLKHIYDILCFAPLWVEHMIESKPASTKTVQAQIDNQAALASDEQTKQLTSDTSKTQKGA